MLRFPYQEELLTGPAPPSLPAGATRRWRPLVPVSLIAPGGLTSYYPRALLDPGADDTVFPIDTAYKFGILLRQDTGHRVRWRGQSHPLRFGDVELILFDGTGECRWPAVVAFSPAPLPYPLLGISGCLEFFDARFLGADRFAEIEPNRSYPGTTS
jgi:hypothetical protein